MPKASLQIDTTTTRVQFDIPVKMLEDIDKLVAKGKYRHRADFVRQSCAYKILGWERNHDIKII